MICVYLKFSNSHIYKRKMKQVKWILIIHFNHVISILKVTNELFYVVFSYQVFQIHCMFYTSQRGHAVLQVFNSHIGLLAVEGAMEVGF